jgi:hypothetical protein
MRSNEINGGFTSIQVGQTCVLAKLMCLVTIKMHLWIIGETLRSMFFYHCESHFEFVYLGDFMQWKSGLIRWDWLVGDEKQLKSYA